MRSLVARYEALSGAKDATLSSGHHEQTLSVQKTYFGKVDALFKALQEMGNPFQEQSADLLRLDTKDVADPALASMVSSHHTRGRSQFKAFMDGLKKDTSSFYQVIKKNTVSFFKWEKKPTMPRTRCSRRTVTCSLDSSYPAKPGNVTCRNFSNMRISQPQHP